MPFRSRSMFSLFSPAALCLVVTLGAGPASALEMPTSGVPASVTADFAAALGPVITLPPGVSRSDVPLEGSWRQSCTEAELRNTEGTPRGLFLFAECKTVDGSLASTNLNMSACAQPPRFGNHNGNLVCESGPYARETVPGQHDGYWILSCAYFGVSGMTLSAICSNDSGGVTKTSLNFGSCGQPAQIIVVNGELTCGNGPRNLPIGGSWASSCINEKMSGTTLTALCYPVSGPVRETSLDVSTCNAPATAGNQDGNLVCESGVKPPEMIATPQVAPIQTPPVSLSQLDQRTIVPQTAPIIVQPQAAPQIAPVVAAPVVTTPPVVVTPSPAVATASATPTTSFAGAWTIVTERGDSFALDMKLAGNAASGTIPFGGQTFNLNGSVLGAGGEKMSLVWQVGDLAGTGELVLGPSKQEFAGKLLLGDGTPLQGGVWKGTRKGSGPGLPFGEVKAGTALPQAAAGAAPAAGYERAVSTTELAIRDKASSKNSKIVGSLKTGEVVNVSCPAGNRYWCQLQDGRGWVSRQYINIGATGTATPVPTTTNKAATSATKTTSKAATKTTTTTAKTAQPVKKQEVKKDDNGNTKFIQGLGLGVGLGIILGNQ